MKDSDKITNKNINSKINEYMIACGLKNDSDLLEKLDMTQSRFSNIRRGQAMPTLSQLIQIADVIGCSLDELIGREKTLEKNEKMTARKICELIFELYKAGFIAFSDRPDFIQEACGSGNFLYTIRFPEIEKIEDVNKICLHLKDSATVISKRPFTVEDNKKQINHSINTFIFKLNQLFDVPLPDDLMEITISGLLERVEG